MNSLDSGYCGKPARLARRVPPPENSNSAISSTDFVFILSGRNYLRMCRVDRCPKEATITYIFPFLLTQTPDSGHERGVAGPFTGWLFTPGVTCAASLSVHLMVPSVFPSVPLKFFSLYSIFSPTLALSRLDAHLCGTGVLFRSFAFSYRSTFIFRPAKSLMKK